MIEKRKLDWPVRALNYVIECRARNIFAVRVLQMPSANFFLLNWTANYEAKWRYFRKSASEKPT